MDEMDTTTSPAQAAEARAADEAKRIAERYARRDDGDRYAPLRPEVMQVLHERQRAMRALFAAAGWPSLADRTVAELGCGAGGNLLELMRLGAAPERLTGIELLPDRHAHARRMLPPAVALWRGDALAAPVHDGSQDLVLQSTVLSSVLDADVRRALAATMWRWLRPGGAVLSYDLAVDNPRNPDVRGVPPSELRALFPEARITLRRVTLAPPLARRLAGWSPGLPAAVNLLLPMLRTHRLAWIAKP